MLALLAEIKDKFPRYFGTPFAQFYDGLLSVAFHRTMIDLPAFSEWLNAPDGVTDLEYIEQRFGKEAAQWFDKTFISI